MSVIDTQVGRHIRQHEAELALAISQRVWAQADFYVNHENDRGGPSFVELVGHLAQALSVAEPVILTEHIENLARGLAGRGRDVAQLKSLLEATDDVLQALLSATHWAAARPYLMRAIQTLGQPPITPEAAALQMPELARKYLAGILQRQRATALKVLDDAIDGGITVDAAYLDILQPAQRHVGVLWAAGRVSVAMEHYCTMATLTGMARLMDRAAAPMPRHRRVFVGMSVAGELHDVGLRMVGDLLDLDGWDVHFLGASTPHDAAVSELIACGAAVAGISVTVLTHVDSAAELVRAIRFEPRCANVKIMVGGRPFELAPGLWQKIGADGSAADARQAVVEAKRLART